MKKGKENVNGIRPIQIKDMSVVEMKAAIYDLMSQVERSQTTIRTLTQEIQSRKIITGPSKSKLDNKEKNPDLNKATA